MRWLQPAERAGLRWPIRRSTASAISISSASSGLHHDAEGLGLGGGAGTVEAGCAASALNVAVGIHLQSSGRAHAICMGAIGGGKPASRDAFVDREGEHLCKVRLDEGRWLVDHVVKEAVGTLAGKTSVDDLACEIGQTLPLAPALAGQAAPDAGQARSSPSVAAAPEVAVLELLLLVVPDVSEELLVRVPESLPIALDLGQRFVVKAHRREERR